MYTHRGSWMTQGRGWFPALQCCSCSIISSWADSGSVVGNPESCLMVFFHTTIIISKSFASISDYMIECV